MKYESKCKMNFRTAKSENGTTRDRDDDGNNVTAHFSSCILRRRSINKIFTKTDIYTIYIYIIIQVI